MPLRQTYSPPKQQIGVAVSEWSDPQAQRGLTLSEQPSIDRNFASRVPPPRAGTMPVATTHRTRHSQDDDRRMRRDVRDRKQDEKGNIFANPDNISHKRPTRRNSESSIFESKEDEHRMRELRHRERAARAKDGKKRDGKSSRSQRPNQRLDLIDRLDITNLYGAATFHHDGPFDACNPHRNRKGARGAPMQAFPKDSANNALGGSGPVNKNLDFERFHGIGAEGYSDYNATPQNTSAVADQPYTITRRPYVERANSDSAPFHPKDRSDIVYGDETAGLGASTFLEGTPASRAALQRRESETEATTVGGASGSGGGNGGGGLTRKRSLAQKLRGYGRPRPYGDGARVTSPEGRGYIGGDGAVRSPGSPQYAPANSQSPTKLGHVDEIDPFFGDGAEKKETRIQVQPLDDASNGGLGRSRTTSSPKGYNRNRTGSSPPRGILRNGTGDETNDSQGKTTGGGLLGRVKSLKGRGKRPERNAN
ncbi:MAG: hypothetical protein M1828_002900 [Chrysothrix sp. TS-e1954]|nr:MAG: hypothetical protein M1828_002900 [Chrysothrix sp. TS-e1954]